MKWFKKERENDPSVEVVAQRIASKILKVQRRLADNLNTKAKDIPKKKLAIMLGFIALAFGGYSLWLILSLFR
ncbi:hypothetical protein ACFOWA_19420 [Pedobacter lithocola]|uniref:Uncharacterized protein n=1 Tax=Pedobacter lithocola TaxID=1908239 RepID=A0ABV8PGL1_9SPHI